MDSDAMDRRMAEKELAANAKDTGIVVGGSIPDEYLKHFGIDNCDWVALPTKFYRLICFLLGMVDKANKAVLDAEDKIGSMNDHINDLDMLNTRLSEELEDLRGLAESRRIRIIELLEDAVRHIHASN